MPEQYNEFAVVKDFVLKYLEENDVQVCSFCRNYEFRVAGRGLRVERRAGLLILSKLRPIFDHACMHACMYVCMYVLERVFPRYQSLKL